MLYTASVFHSSNVQAVLSFVWNSAVPRAQLLVSDIFNDLVHDICLSCPKTSNMETKPHMLLVTAFELSEFLKGDIKLALELINYYYNCREPFKIGFECILSESYRSLLSRVKIVDLVSFLITLKGLTYFADTISWDTLIKILCIHSYLHCRIVSGKLYLHLHKTGKIIHKAVIALQIPIFIF